MNKFLILLTTLVGFSAAGVVDIGVMRDRNLEQLGGGTHKIQEMTRTDLQHQKFLLDVLQRVNGPPTNEQIVRLGQTLVTDPRLYIGGIDGDMELVIELANQQNLIGQNEIFTIRNENHVRQMRGMYQLLVRSGDWDTLQRNIAYLRLNVNSVAFVNALVLALRDREDTQMLIVPGVEEILPEVYLDQEVVRKAQNININTLQNNLETQRPSLWDLIGLRKRTTGLSRFGLDNDSGILNKEKFWMPWRDMKLDLVQRKLNGIQERIAMKGLNKLVIPMELGQLDNDLNLVTEDVGLKTFVQDIINNLVLIEGDKLNMNDRLRGQSSRLNGILDMDERRQLMQERNIDNERQNVFGRMQNRDMNMGGVEDLPSSDINNERLLHVNRRRGGSNFDQEQTQSLGNERTRFEDVMRGGRVSDGRRISQQMEDDEDLINFGWTRIPIMRKTNEGTTIRNNMRQQKNMNMNVNHELPTTTIDNERLLHVNRRRLNQQNENDESLIGHRFSSSIGDGRRVDSKNLKTDEDREGQRQRFINKMTENDDDVIIRTNTGERLTRKDLLQLISESGLTIGDIIDSIKQNRAKSTGRINPLLLQRMQQENDMNDRYLLQNSRRTMDDINELEDEDSMLNGNLMRRRVPRSLRNSEMLGGDRLHEKKVQQVIEVILHNIQQLAARINLERIALGQQGQVNSKRINNPNLLDSMDQSYALRLNEMRGDMSKNRMLLERIGNVERRLETVISDALSQIMDNSGSDISNEQIVNRVIGNVVTGRLGNVGILDILRQLGGLSQQQMRLNKGNGLEIDLADPVVQHLLNRIVRIVDKLRQEHLGSRQLQDLEMKGVTINDVRVDQLVTFIDESDLDLVNLLNTDMDRQLNDEQNIEKMVVARQKRLNHKHFKIDLDITSERNQRVVVRMLLGPKTDVNGRETSLDERRQNFVLLDTITANLQTGRNRITRDSSELAYTVQDTTPYTEIYQQVMSAIRGDVSMIKQRKVIGQSGYFPHRLLLPRGQVQGLPMELLVIATPVENVDYTIRSQQNLGQQIAPIGMSTINVDNESLGFPLDRQIVNENQLLNLSNVKVKDVLIYHKN